MNPICVSFLVCATLASISTLAYAVDSQQQQQQSSSQTQSGTQQIGSYVSQGNDKSSKLYTTNTQVLDNPSYDPNIYQTFVPQDAVQQYVQQYGGQYMPQTAYSSNYDPAGFTVQTGYEGFLVPAEPPTQSTSLFPALIRSLPLPKSIASLIMKVGAFLISSVGVVVAGGFLTTLLCTFTPVCKIALLAPIFGIAKNNQVAETIAETVAENVTAERVKRAAEFVRNALEKYAQLNMELNPKPSVAAKVSPAAVEVDTSA